MIDYDGYNLTIIFEIWRFKEFIYKLIDRLFVVFKKGRFFIDCGYCTRKNKMMICQAAGRGSSPGPCYKECYQEEGL